MTNVTEVIRSLGLVRRDESIGGLILSVTGTRNISVSSGTLWSMLNEFAFAGLNTASSGTFEYYWYKAGTGWQSSDATQYSVTQWNDVTQTALQTIDANKYLNVWVYGEFNAGVPSVALIYPQAQYNTAAAAEAKPAPDNLPTHIKDVGKLLGRIIIKQGVDAPISVETVFTTTFSNSVVTDHGNLSGLSDDDHTQYWLSGTARTGNFSTSGTLGVGATTVTSLDAGSGLIQTTGDIQVGDDLLFPNANSIINFGSGDITLTYTANTLTFAGMTTLAFGTSNVSGIGTLGAGAITGTSLTATGTAIINDTYGLFYDNKYLYFGSSADSGLVWVDALSLMYWALPANGTLMFSPNSKIYLTDDANRQDAAMAIQYETTKDYTSAKEIAGTNSNFLFSNQKGDYTWGAHFNLDGYCDHGKGFLIGLHGTNDWGLFIVSDDANNTNLPINIFQAGTNGSATQDIIRINAAERWTDNANIGAFTGDFLHFRNAQVDKFRVDSSGNVVASGDLIILSDSSKLELGNVAGGDLQLYHDGTNSYIYNDTGVLKIQDAGSGINLGTATTQLLGFYGVTPVDQPANTADIKDALIELGLLATGGATPLNLDSGDFTGAYISTGGNELLATDIVRHTITATDVSNGYWTESWSKATAAKIASFTVVRYRPSTTQVFSSLNAAFKDDTGSYVAVVNSAADFVADDVMTLKIVYEK
jgi:hypothetical protein